MIKIFCLEIYIINWWNFIIIGFYLWISYGVRSISTYNRPRYDNYHSSYFFNKPFLKNNHVSLLINFISKEKLFIMNVLSTVRIFFLAMTQIKIIYSNE